MIQASGKEIIGTFRKNRFHVIRVSFGEYDGKAFVYLHSFQQPEGVADSGAEERAGGMTLAPHVWRGLIPLIEQACDVADKRSDGGRA